MVTSATAGNREFEGELTSAEERAWAVLNSVADPEIPVISIVDLGIVRHVRERAGKLEIGVTPTYSGCPATEVIRGDIAKAMADAGMGDARIVTVLSPPWSTDWITPQGSAKLRDYGIAPPQRAVTLGAAPLHAQPPAVPRGAGAADPLVECPRCRSRDTETLSEFGSTPCKALHRCRHCLEPFERFKCL